MTKLFFLPANDVHLAYRIYENEQAQSDRTAVFIHGAGVGGELTWADLLPHLTQWSKIIMPDLKGMGDTFVRSNDDQNSKLETPTSINELADHVIELLDFLELKNFDLVGYSLGGLVSLVVNKKLVQRQASFPKVEKMALLEPASLDRAALDQLVEVRRRYREAASIIRDTGDVEQGVKLFINSVAPNRRKHPVAEATTESRLAHRPLGFSFALDAVTDFVEHHDQQTYTREELLAAAPPVLLFSGELSHELLREYHFALAEQNDDWHSLVIKGTDHSLPFQKPRQIAQHMDKWFAKNTITEEN